MRDTTHETGGSLKEYRAKRNFRQTTEPPPVVAKPKKGGALFVIQKHDASRLHYDFRLEVDGVLKSWAVPKGLPMTRGERRLAIQVEDHPFDYAHFEGTIAEGNYGAGTVMVWDTGEYQAQLDLRRGLAEGKLHLTLHGRKLNGEWTLVRLRGREEGEKPAWLIFKSGSDASPVKGMDDSVLSGRSMEEISRSRVQWKSNRKAKGIREKATRRMAPKGIAAKEEGERAGKAVFVTPMKCRLISGPPASGDWRYELKFDGIRAIAVMNKKAATLYSRAENDLTARFHEIGEAVEKLAETSMVLDGEIVALDKEGRSSFQLLQSPDISPGKKPPIYYYIFDILHLNGRDLKKLPLERRREILQSMLEKAGDPLRYSASLEADPKKLLAEVRRRGLEGLIAKRSGSTYEAGLRTGSWSKIKVLNEQELVIGGYTAPQGARQKFGALLVGFYERGKLLFASKVGTGFSDETLKKLHQRFQTLRMRECPFANLPEKKGGRYSQGLTLSAMKQCVWVKPELVCQVRFAEWTRDGHLRQPAYMGLREEKKAREVKRERAQSAV